MNLLPPHWPDGFGDAPGLRRGFILDVRLAAAFDALHLAGATSHPWLGAGGNAMAAWLPSIFLPPRHEPLLVVAPDADVGAAVVQELRARGRRTVDGVVLDQTDLEGLPADLLSRGPSRKVLWRPPPWLSDHMALLPPPALGPVVDLGCGSGRAAVWLARRGYRATGLDHQPEALVFGRQLAAASGCGCTFADADLRRPEAWPAGPWALLINLRFLQRDMLAHMAGRTMPGGVAVVRTFRDVPGYHGHPHPKHRLRPGELLGFFDRCRFEILAHEEGFDGDGRPAAGIVARRRVVPGLL